VSDYLPYNCQDTDATQDVNNKLAKPSKKSQITIQHTYKHPRTHQMSGTLQAKKDKVALRNTIGFPLNKWDHLRNACAFAAERPLDNTLLPDKIVTRLKEIGCQTAAEAALVRLLDSPDETMVHKGLSVLASMAPKEMTIKSVNISLTDMSVDELVALAASGDDVEGGTTTE
jgi:hypothetical protein